jgi:fused signal recognition particle receptor
VDALAGNDATKQAVEFHKAISLDGVILAKMDADAKGGALISVTYATKGVPILYLGTGQKYDDLDLFDPKLYLKKLLK